MAKAARREPHKTEKGLGIFVGWQYDGGVYALEPLSRDRIEQTFPETLINPAILLGYDKTEDYNRFHRPYWPTLAMMLTGLTAEQIAQLGGVYIYDPHAQEVIWRWNPAEVSAEPPAIPASYPEKAASPGPSKGRRQARTGT